jgi:tetratricopeptide (TPR) repeat protein
VLEKELKKLKKNKNPESAFKLSDYYFKLRSFTAACYYGRLLTELDKGASSFYYYGSLCLQLGKNEEAVEFLTQANEKGHETAYMDLAIALRFTGNYNQAKLILESKNNYTRLAQHYREMRDFDKAIEYYKKAQDNQSVIELAMCYLMVENWQEGWKLFEIRWGLLKKIKDLISKMGISWSGEDLSNKHLVLFCEQGYGDIIQFLRYIPFLKNSYKNLKISIFLKTDHISIKSLLSFIFPDINVNDNFLLLGKVDYICSFLSLPFLLKHNSPKDIPSLTVSIPQKETIYKIGLCYSGDATHPQDHFRSMFAKEFNITSEWVDLTKDRKPRMWLGSGEVRLYEGTNMARKDFRDWLDTAEFIAGLDEIISIDSAVAHLAGIMGKKVTLLLSYVSEWRWGTTDNNWWYNNMTLVRQDTYNNWASAIKKLNII